MDGEAKQISTDLDEALRILLVEDNDDMAEVTALALSMLGHRTIRAASLAEAERWLAETESAFDAIVADYSLPDGRGSELLRRRPDVPSILLTGYAEYDLPPNALGNSRAIVRMKPVDFDQLESALQAARAAHT